MSTYALVYSRTLQWLSVVFLAAMWLLVAFILSPLALSYFRFDTTPGTVRRPLSASDQEAIQALLATTTAAAAASQKGLPVGTVEARSQGLRPGEDLDEGDRKVVSAGPAAGAGAPPAVSGSGTESVLPAPASASVPQAARGPQAASASDSAGQRAADAASAAFDRDRDAAAETEMARWAGAVGTPSLPAEGLGGPMRVEAPLAGEAIQSDASVLTGDVGATGMAGMMGTGCGAVRMEQPSRPDYPHAGVHATAMTQVGVTTASEAPQLHDDADAASSGGGADGAVSHDAGAPEPEYHDENMPRNRTDATGNASGRQPLQSTGQGGNASAATRTAPIQADASGFGGTGSGKQPSREERVAAELAATGRITPVVDFPRVALVFKDVHYSVRTRTGEDKPLLRSCSGAFLPYTLNCLMGSSGAGKTTLLDVLAFRKTTGKVSGTIRLNGSPLSRESAAFLHFAEQEDIHLPSATVGEAMRFSAALRMPHHVSPQQREVVLQRVARLLELGPLLDRVVGSLSRSEMKRLTIAVELSALPSVIFLDEPTSFLSASSAAIVMRALRRVAATGRTVICTSESAYASDSLTR